MSLNRYAKKTDTSQPLIIEALRRAGWYVWIIGWPCDLLCWKSDKGFRCLEAKTLYGKKNPKAVIDKRQQGQIAFLETTCTPRVGTPEEAIEAVRKDVAGQNG